jgi:hypothetical protein
MLRKKGLLDLLPHQSNGLAKKKWENGGACAHLCAQVKLYLKCWKIDLETALTWGRCKVTTAAGITSLL